MGLGVVLILLVAFVLLSFTQAGILPWLADFVVYFDYVILFAFVVAIADGVWGTYKNHKESIWRALVLAIPCLFLAIPVLDIVHQWLSVPDIMQDAASSSNRQVMLLEVGTLSVSFLLRSLLIFGLFGLVPLSYGVLFKDRRGKKKKSVFSRALGKVKNSLSNQEQQPELASTQQEDGAETVAFDAVQQEPLESKESISESSESALDASGEKEPEQVSTENNKEAKNQFANGVVAQSTNILVIRLAIALLMVIIGWFAGMYCADHVFHEVSAASKAFVPIVGDFSITWFCAFSTDVFEMLGLELANKTSLFEIWFQDFLNTEHDVEWLYDFISAMCEFFGLDQVGK